MHIKLDVLVFLLLLFYVLILYGRIQFLLNQDKRVTLSFIGFDCFFSLYFSKTSLICFIATGRDVGDTTLPANNDVEVHLWI